MLLLLSVIYMAVAMVMTKDSVVSKYLQVSPKSQALL